LNEIDELNQYLRTPHMKDSREDFGLWAMKIAVLASERSTCARRKTGAVAVGMDNRILSIGYNGVPHGVPHCIESPCPGANDPSGNTENCLAVHADVNCVLNASSPKEISKIYCTASPCLKCACVLANLPNLKEVWYLELYTDTRGVDLLTSCNIDCRRLK